MATAQTACDRNADLEARADQAILDQAHDDVLPFLSLADVTSIEDLDREHAIGAKQLERNQGLRRRMAA